MAISEESRTLEQAIEALTVAARRPARRETENIAASVETICQHALTFGLKAAALESVIELVTVKNSLKQTNVIKLLDHLRPAQCIRFEAIVRVIGALGLGKFRPSPAIQKALIRWLIARCDVLEQRNLITRYYGVLFNLLDIISLRTPMCHLLSIITGRKHVKPFRAQQLLELLHSSDYDQTVACLLRVYRDCDPNITADEYAYGHKQLSNASECESRKESRIRRQFGIRVAESSDTECKYGIEVARHKDTKEGGPMVLPYAHIAYRRIISPILDLLSSAQDFTACFERKGIPCRATPKIRKSTLQMQLSVNESDIYGKKISAIHEDVYKRIIDREVNLADARFLLDGLLQLAVFTKCLLPCTLKFLHAFVPIWDGQICMDEILGLLSFLPLMDFKHLHESILRPVEHVALARVSNPTDVILSFYSKLTTNWIVKMSVALSVEEKDKKHHQANLDQLIYHIFSIILSNQAAVEKNNTSPQASLFIWRYASINHKLRSTPMALPSPKILYNTLFNATLQDISSVCASLAIYKTAFEMRHNLGFHYSKDVVDRFNGNLMNVCNVIWRSRAFLGRGADAHSRMCSESLAKELQAYLAHIDLDYSLSFLFGLSHNPTLAALSAASTRALEDRADRPEEPLTVRHEGPVTQRSLAKLTDDGGLDVSWHSLRDENLKYLESHGVYGIKTLMYVTIKDLMRAIK